MTDTVAYKPQRATDPFIENELRGTRMPDYANVPRDIPGELGWIPNFDVKLSRDNHLRHKNMREFFD